MTKNWILHSRGPLTWNMSNCLNAQNITALLVIFENNEINAVLGQQSCHYELHL